jgi:hypothetical protein
MIQPIAGHQVHSKNQESGHSERTLPLPTTFLPLPSLHYSDNP